MGGEEKVLSETELKQMIADTIKASGPEAAKAMFEEMKKETNKAEMKAIFPHFGEEGDFTGGELKNRSGSVLDFSTLRKAASRGQTDAEYALSLTSIGGPFKKLSPAMEMWGRMLKCTGNRCWIEKVDESGAVGIYLEDGAIVEKKEEQPAAK